MINYHKTLVSALNSILPTYYEMVLTADSETPCISYMERNNHTTDSGDTLGYSRISYTVKVWGNDIATIQEYAKQIDDTLRPLGWQRISSQEMYSNVSSLIQKIMNYEALAMEVY